MSAPEKHRLSQILNLTVFVAALGYFVDMFDLLLFPIVRQPSLTDLGIPQGDAQVPAMFLLLNFQMVGMLLGGIFWGVLGDKKGRLSTLFGSIALYSVANIGNAFVHGLPSYAAWRFLAGFGLAGELGAAVTLVSEILPRNLRAYGTAIVAGVSWKPGVREWEPLKGREGDVGALFRRLKASPELIEAFAGFLRTIGSALIPDALPDVADKLTGGAPEARFTDRAIQRLEPILSSLIYGGSIPIRREERYRAGILTLLDAMIEGGSSSAYRMRDDFLTPLAARP